MSKGNLFPGISWEEKKLEEVVFHNEKRGERADSFYYIDLESVNAGVVSQKKLVEKKTAPSRAQRILHNGDILFQNVRPYQRNNLIFSDEESEQVVASTGFTQMSPKEGICGEFIYQALLTDAFNARVMLRCTGTSYPAINSSDLMSIPIMVPSLPNQKKIAAFLSALDERIELQSRKVGLLREQKRGYQQRVFNRELVFTDDNGNPYPEWEKLSLSSISQRVKRTADDPAGLDVLTISAGNGFLNQKERFSQVIAGNSLSKYTLLKEGELSYNRGASSKYKFGCVYSLKGYAQALVPNVYRSFMMKEGHSAGFYEQYFGAGLVNSELRRLVSSGARMDGLLNMGEDDFYSIKVPVPSSSEQEKIAEFFSALDENIELNERKLGLLKEEKQGYLQAIFG